MEACTAQTGLLRKKPCGENAVTKCGNCEQPLCGKHAVRDMSAGKKAGFLCQECAKAWKESEKTMGALLVLTGIAFLTGFVSEASYWLLEAFPVLGRIG